MSFPSGLVVDAPALAGGIAGGNRTRALDSFTDVDGTAITSHIPEIGTWTKHTAGSTNTAAPTIIGNRLVGENAATNSLYTIASPSTPNVIVACDVVMRSDNNVSQCGLVGRVVAGAATYYHARYNTLANAWQLYKFVVGAATQLGTDQAAVLTVDAVNPLQLSIIGSTIGMIVGGVTLVSVTDAAIPAAGLAGFKLASASTATTGLHLDSLSVRSL